MNIDWATLGQVFGASLLLTVTLVAVFSLGIVGVSGRAADSGPRPLVRAGAYACYALCAAAVAYGIYVIAA